MRIDSHGYSPAVITKAVKAGGGSKSFKHAAEQMTDLAEVPMSHTQVARLTHEIGRGLAAERDQQAERYQRRDLPAKAGQAPVELALVEMDGGRQMTRARDQSRGVHDKQWKEPKVGVLWRMTGDTFDEDPHPELPRCFEDRQRVPKLVRDIHGSSGRSQEGDTDHGITLEEIVDPANEDMANEEAMGGETHRAECDDSPPSSAVLSDSPPDAGRKKWQPKRVFRTCIATLRNVFGFGLLLAAEAQWRGFYQAARKAFVGDGQDANWTVWRLHFPDFTPITDFMHAVAYAYTAAQVLSGNEGPWAKYLDYARAIWQGRVGEVIDELEAWLKEHPLPDGVPLKEISDQDERKILHESVTYFRNNQERMKYPEYRKQGMPVTSSLIESLIKEINWRVKGTEKFWNRADEPKTSKRTNRRVRGQTGELPKMSGESILQVRAALLCDDNRLEQYILSRPGCPYVRSPKPTRTAA